MYLNPYLSLQYFVNHYIVCDFLLPLYSVSFFELLLLFAPFGIFNLL